MNYTVGNAFTAVFRTEHQGFGITAGSQIDGLFQLKERSLIVFFYRCALAETASGRLGFNRGRSGFNGG